MTDMDLLPQGDDFSGFGLGYIESPPDERDFSIDMAYSLYGVDTAVTLPAAYTVLAPYPPTLNQGNTPMCVAYSHSWLKAYQDLRDTGPVNLDEPLFFQRIGGTANGAVIRNGMDQLVKIGYPEVVVGNPQRHKITNYYSVPMTREDICLAIYTFGPIEIGVQWCQSWMKNPGKAMVLPAPTAVNGGHATVAIGWDDRGLICMNSWGSLYGDGGKFIIPWAYFSRVREGWKAIDDVLIKTPRAYRIAVKKGTVVQMAKINSKGLVYGWDRYLWSSPDSGAPCQKPTTKKTTTGVTVPVTYVTAGKFKGRYVRISPPGTRIVFIY